MTSMPASRRARAMIFAPRSCPSRPGLATTTRIFWLDGAGSVMGARGRRRSYSDEPESAVRERSAPARRRHGLARRREALALLVLAVRAEVADLLAALRPEGPVRAD